MRSSSVRWINSSYMDQVLKTFVVEYGSSSFRIELMQSDRGRQYVLIKQTVFTLLGESEASIRIRLEAFGELMEALGQIRMLMEIPKVTNRKEPTVVQQSEIVHRYLNKSISLEDLAVQFDCSVSMIREILFAANVSLVNPKFTDSYTGKNYWKRKRRPSK